MPVGVPHHQGPGTVPAVVTPRGVQVRPQAVVPQPSAEFLDFQVLARTFRQARDMDGAHPVTENLPGGGCHSSGGGIGHRPCHRDMEMLARRPGEERGRGQAHHDPLASRCGQRNNARQLGCGRVWVPGYGLYAQLPMGLGIVAARHPEAEEQVAQRTIRNGSVLNEDPELLGEFAGCGKLYLGRGDREGQARQCLAQRPQPGTHHEPVDDLVADTAVRQPSVELLMQPVLDLPDLVVSAVIAGRFADQVSDRGQVGGQRDGSGLVTIGEQRVIRTVGARRDLGPFRHGEQRPRKEIVPRPG